MRNSMQSDLEVRPPCGRIKGAHRVIRNVCAIRAWSISGSSVNPELPEARRALEDGELQVAGAERIFIPVG